MRAFIFFVTITLCVVIQRSFTFLDIGIKPDILLILVLFSALLGGPISGLKAGAIVGLVEDIIVGKYFGMHILTKMLTGLVIGLMEPKIFKENYLVPVVTLFLGTILNECLFIFFGNIIGIHLLWADSLWHQIVPLAIYHAVLAPFFYVPFYKIYVSKWFNNEA